MSSETTKQPQQTKWSDRRRGIRMNSRVPVIIEWRGSDGGVVRHEGFTRIVNPYGCLVVLPHDLALEQPVTLTNLQSCENISALVVWRGNARAEGFELGIELVNPEMDFWGLDL